MPGSGFHFRFGHPNQRARWLRWVLGLILVTAAVLKLLYWLEGPHDIEFTATSLSMPALVAFEIFLGVWILSGMSPDASLLVVTGTFGIFAAVSLWKIAHGYRDCGCFGTWSLSPFVTYWIDIAAFGAGVFLFEGTRKRGRVMPLVLLFATGLFAAALHVEKHAILNPGIGIDSEWPPTEVVDLPSDIFQGRWIVLIYQSSCGHCRIMASNFAAQEQLWQSQGKKVRLALIDANPDPSQEKPWSRPGLIQGRLLPSEFFHETPIVLLVVGGRVRAVREGWGEIDWNSAPYSGWVR